MEVKVKICAITSLKDALFAVNCGADALGFLVDAPPCPKDEQISAKDMKSIVSKLPETIWTFALTFSADPIRIIKICRDAKPTHVQIIEDLRAEELALIKKKVPKVKLVKVIAVDGPDAISKAKSYCNFSDFLLLDSHSNGKTGGTGKTHDWNLSAKIVSEVSRPVFLAGGLNPGNLQEAIEKVRPYGVDVCTGVSKSLGKKDFDKVREFMGIARNY